MEFCSRDPIGYADGQNLFQYLRNNPTYTVDPYGLLQTEPTDPHSPVNPAGCDAWYRSALKRLSEIPWYDAIERVRYFRAITDAYFACLRRVDDLPLDDRPHYPGIPYDSYNCAGLALRTYKFESDREALMKKLAPYLSNCEADCKCGETKCRLWTWTTQIFTPPDPDPIELHGDFHIVCAKIPGNSGTGKEPRCFEKIGKGPVSGPIYPIDAEPHPSDIPGTNPGDVVKLANLKQTCYCLPEGFAEK